MIIMRKGVLIFFVFTMVMTCVTGIFMWYGYYNRLDIGRLATVQTIYPATGAMIAIWATKGKNVIPETFFGVFLCVGGVMVIMATGSMVFPSIFHNTGSIQMTCLISLVVGAVAMGQEEKLAKAYGIKGGDFKSSVFVTILFVSMYMVLLLFKFYIMDGNMDNFYKSFTVLNTFLGVIGIIPLFFLSFLPYFGEEYGWRFFLQPILQKRLGKRVGVVVLGIIWGIWHLPLCFFYYASPENGLIALANQIGGCILLGIFFAYAYMKTGSIWTVSMLHFINNHMPVILNLDSSVAYNGSWTDLFKNFFIGVCLFGILLFSKPFRSDEYKILTVEERVEAYESALVIPQLSLNAPTD